MTTYREEENDGFRKQKNERSEKRRLDDFCERLLESFLLCHVALISSFLSKLLRSLPEKDDGVGFGEEEGSGQPSGSCDTEDWSERGRWERENVRF